MMDKILEKLALLCSAGKVEIGLHSNGKYVVAVQIVIDNRDIGESTGNTLAAAIENAFTDLGPTVCDALKHLLVNDSNMRRVADARKRSLEQFQSFGLRVEDKKTEV